MEKTYSYSWFIAAIGFPIVAYILSYVMSAPVNTWGTIFKIVQAVPLGIALILVIQASQVAEKKINKDAGTVLFLTALFLAATTHYFSLLVRPIL